MEPPELSARLRYLNDSAHLLATASPTTSRYLMSRHNALMYDSKLELSEAQKKKACGACGAIMILGWEATLESEGRSLKGKPRKVKEDAKQQRVMVYTCRTCAKKTRFPTGTPKPMRRNKAALNSASISTVPTPRTQASNTIIPAQKAPKRKARKKGVLDAILARSQAPQASSSGFGLDLADFMKKS